MPVCVWATGSLPLPPPEFEKESLSFPSGRPAKPRLLTGWTLGSHSCCRIDGEACEFGCHKPVCNVRLLSDLCTMHDGYCMTLCLFTLLITESAIV